MFHSFTLYSLANRKASEISLEKVRSSKLWINHHSTIDENLISIEKASTALLRELKISYIYGCNPYLPPHMQARREECGGGGLANKIFLCVDFIYIKLLTPTHSFSLLTNFLTSTLLPFSVVVVVVVRCRSTSTSSTFMHTQNPPHTLIRPLPFMLLVSSFSPPTTASVVCLAAAATLSPHSCRTPQSISSNKKRKEENSFFFIR